MKKLTLSIIIPVFNEEKRVSKALKALQSYLPKQNYESEVIFVDDGSLDKTVEMIKKRQLKNYKIISYQPNRGKGYALKKGVLDSKGDWVVLLDVDMSTPIESLEDFLPFMERKMPVIIGTRKAKGAVVSVHQKVLRQKMGEFYTFLANVLIAPGITDFTCGFKCFSKKAAQEVFSRLKTNRWSWDAEVIYLAKKMNLEIREVPVKWADDPRTKVDLVKDSLGSFIDLLKIRFYH